MRPQRSALPKLNVRIYSDKYLVRTIKPDDASDRWASWSSDPEAIHMLNLPAQKMTRNDIADYIAEFDQRSRLLLGIFVRENWLHIGIMTMDIRHGQIRGNLLIGDPAYRNKGVITEITVPFRDYFFETIGLNTMRGTVLARNEIMKHYLLKTGWKLDQTIKEFVKSKTDGAMLDLSLFSLTRDEWRDWKKKNLEQKPASEVNR